jgi:hypothetical protein
MPGWMNPKYLAMGTEYLSSDRSRKCLLLLDRGAAPIAGAGRAWRGLRIGVRSGVEADPELD